MQDRQDSKTSPSTDYPSKAIFSNTVLAGKTAIVSGASRGIGLAIATSMYQSGARIVALARRPLTDPQCDHITAGCKDSSSRLLTQACDIQSDEAIKSAINKTIETFGQIDILVNNAGIARDGLLMRAKDADWDDTINTNLKGAFLFCRAAAKYLLKAKENGRIINISSVIGDTGNAGQSIYAASKAGLCGFTRSLAHEFASRGVTVNAISPGFIRSDMTQDLIASDKGDVLRNSIPLKRIGDPEDIAHAAVFLSSPAGRYITGQILRINGGLFMG